MLDLFIQEISSWSSKPFAKVLRLLPIQEFLTFDTGKNSLEAVSLSYFHAITKRYKSNETDHFHLLTLTSRRNGMCGTLAPSAGT